MVELKGSMPPNSDIAIGIWLSGPLDKDRTISVLELVLIPTAAGAAPVGMIQVVKNILTGPRSL